MGKRPDPGNCIYCLDFSENLTWDHVLPLSWYPDSTPENIEKWKVPSCLKCNRELGRIEEDLLLKLGLCLDPQSIASLGISHKVLRSVNSIYGKNDRDKRIRENKRKKILNEIIHLMEVPDQGFFPNFGPSKSLIHHGHHAIFIHDELLQPYAEKLVRGMTLIIDGKLIDKNYCIELYVLKEGGDPQLLYLFETHSSLYHRGLGYVVRRLKRNDNHAWIYEFLIWQKLLFYVMVHPGDMKD